MIALALNGACAEGKNNTDTDAAISVDADGGLGFSDGFPGAVCGNGVLDPGEQCESPFEACCDPTSCQHMAAGVECRSALDPCDEIETCTGNRARCPDDLIKADGASCPGGGSCVAGVCEGGKKPKSGNVLYYSFNDGTATDYSGNGHHGVPHGAGPSTGKFGQGFAFDGQDDYIEVPDSPSLFVGNELTVEAWLTYTADQQTAYLYSDARDSDTPDTELTIAVAPDGRIGLLSSSSCSDTTYTEVYTASSGVLPQQTWSHLAVTWDGSNVRFYIDGALQDTQPFAHDPCEKTDVPFRVGQGLASDHAFQGSLDELKVSNYAKSEVEIQLSLAHDSTVAVCGNDVLDPGEACDDGNTLSCDGCAADCGTIEHKQTYYRDADNDGEGNPDSAVMAYCDGAGISSSNDDCDDENSAVFPGASEICGDGLDNDCSGGDEPCAGCGNGTLEAGEQCEAPFDDCCNSSTCTFSSSGHVCRPSAAPCDEADSCSGLSASCPADQIKADGTSCPGGTCQAGICTTSGGTSCGNGILEATEQCESPFGPCCDAASCSFRTSSSVCRSATGACDAAESCSGSSADCPADSFKGAGSICRPAQGQCDKAESCDGASAACPVDAFKPDQTTCTGGTCLGGVCDLGSDPLCGNGVIEPGEQCEAPFGPCCDAATCSYRGSSAVCRWASGPCDAEESCSGSSASCPGDGFKSAGTTCRSAISPCDLAESCDGASASCPADWFLPDGADCPGGTCEEGVCNLGSAPVCGNGVIESGEQCEAPFGPCCDAASCSFKSSSTVCRASQGLCDVAESCSGSSATCPADSYKSAGTTCRAAADECDATESCSGSSASCPADGHKPDGTSCSGGTCQGGSCQPSPPVCGNGVIEPGEDCEVPFGPCCDGTSCSFTSSASVCRASAGPCDAAESCSGSSATCPADVFKSAGTTCRAAADECDATESCSGSSASCPADSDRPDGTSCSGGICKGGTCQIVSVVYGALIGQVVGTTNGDFSPFETHIGDANGDGMSDVIFTYAGAPTLGYPNGAQVWVSLSNGAGSYGAVSGYNVGTTDGNFSPFETHVGDANGDGMSDVIFTYTGAATPGYQDGFQVYVSLSSGGSYGPASGSAVGTTDGNFSPFETHVGDANGDGKSDVVLTYAGAASPGYENGAQVWVSLSNGDGTYGAVSGNNVGTMNGDFSPFEIYIGDASGDGTSDVFLIYTGPPSPGLNNGAQVWVSLSNGNGTYGAVSGNNVGTTDGDFSPFETHVGDANGDGTSDAIFTYADAPTPGLNNGAQVWVSLSNGNGTYGAVSGNNVGTTDGNFSPFEIHIGDANGDGTSDAFFTYAGAPTPGLNNGAQVWVSLSNGDGSYSAVSGNNVGTTDGSFSLFETHIGDASGDGKADALFIYANAPSPGQNNGAQVWVSLSTAAP